MYLILYKMACFVQNEKHFSGQGWLASQALISSMPSMMREL
jgi:hypothetical protein